MDTGKIPEVGAPVWQERRVSVVITSFNRQLTVQGAVRSLVNQTIKPFEILVIDDASDPPLRLSVDFPNFKLIRFDKEQGLSSSRNFGIKASKGDYIAFIDDDCVPSRLWLEAVHKGIDTGAEIIGGPLKPLYAATPPTWWTEKDFGSCAGVGNTYTFPLQIWGGNMIFKRTVFDKVGFFDPMLGRKKNKLMSGEDTAMLEKAKSCCITLFVPEAEVLHLLEAKRMTPKYILRWQYYSGKTWRILHSGRDIRALSGVLGVANAVYAVLRDAKGVYKPSIMLSKSARIKQLSLIAFSLGRLLARA